MTKVYRHRRNDTDEIFYIGITTKRKRPFSKQSRNKYWHNVVNKVGYSVEILKENISWLNACELEMLLISEYGRKDLGLGNLVNLTDGGEGIINPTKSVRDSRSNRMKGKKYAKGYKHTDEALIKIGLSSKGNKYRLGLVSPRKGVKLSKETKTKISIAFKGRKYSDNHKLSISKSCSKKVYQYSKEMILINEYYGASQASRITGINKSHIAEVSRGNSIRKTAGGYIWKY